MPRSQLPYLATLTTPTAIRQQDQVYQRCAGGQEAEAERVISVQRTQCWSDECQNGQDAIARVCKRTGDAVPHTLQFAYW